MGVAPAEVLSRIHIYYLPATLPALEADSPQNTTSMLSFTEGGSRRHSELIKDQLLTNVIDGLAAERPFQAWAKLPVNPETYEDGFRKITFADLAHTIDNMAWFLVDCLGEPAPGFPTLAYFGPWDPRHCILAYAACKAGYKILLPSPAFAPAGILHLMASVQCSTILHSAKPLPIIQQLRDASPELRLKEVPTLDQLLASPRRVFPYTKTYAEGQHDPLLVLHTSGTTGPPKPLIWTQGWVARFTRQMTLMPLPGFQSQQKMWQGTEMLQVSPRHHGGTMFVNLVMCISTQTTLVYPLPTEPIALSTVRNVLNATHVDSMTLPPPLINQLGTTETAMLDFIAQRVRLITFGSAPASDAAGLAVARRLRITSSYGHTENGLLPCIRPIRADGVFDPELWNAHYFHPACGGVMRPVPVEGGTDDPGVHELVIERSADPTLEQPVFTMLPPDATEWSTKDLFVRKPGAPDFWLWAGRTDDLIAFESGAKLNPTAFETALRAHPAVKQAAMVGSARPRAALVVEPADPVAAGREAAFLESIAPVIQEANMFCGPLGRIEREHILLTDPGRPLPLTAKGTVAKKAMLEMYAVEVERLYASM